MANIALRFARLGRPFLGAAARNLTSWAAVGTIVALTGFGPEHWFAAAFKYVDLPERRLTPGWLDIRSLIVLVGVSIVVADFLVRTHRQRAAAGPASADASVVATPSNSRSSRVQTDDGPRMSASLLAPPPALPDRPSIVVLPFVNMSGDAEQEYFSDGISEDIITDLSKISSLFVIARNSAFAYKNQAVNVPQVCRDLGVRFAREGSIRKSGNRVRVTAQLIDGATGGHVWAERYDRDLTDIFEVQDDVTRQIVWALKVTLSEAEKMNVARGGARNVLAHDKVLKGRELMILKKDRPTFEKWMACFRSAVELDPDYSDAYAGLSLGYSMDHTNRWSDHPELSLGEATRLADTAIAKDETNPLAHFAAALAAMGRKDYPRWKEENKKALALNPNFAPATVGLANLHVFAGEPMKGVPLIEKAMRLDPTVRGQYLHFLGTAYLVAGDYETAAKMFRDRIVANPDTDLSRALLASALGRLGRTDEARRVWRELQAINPRYSLIDHVDRLPFKNPADAENIIEGVRMAGLP
ncbi:MAG: guanylyl cyclase [Hyphomicrobiales bacterium]|nr:guanylyl cyclase [Hyphomicrobiales bacterium]